MPHVDLDKVREQLFARPAVVTRLKRDFGLPVPTSSTHLAQCLLESFGQVPGVGRSPPASVEHVFRAAVFALGSNSRNWSRFVAVEPILRKLLHDYNPAQSVRAFDTGLTVAQLSEQLGGQTSKADALAIRKWATLLAQVSDYQDHLEHLRDGLIMMGVPPKLAPVATAAVLGFGLQPLSERLLPPPDLGTWKVPGMGAILATEFLRNLRWDAFKPDRHIRRLFLGWFPEMMPEVERDAVTLAERICKRPTTELLDYLASSLLGVAVTPPGVSFSEVDNLVWTLGAYVETKGRETTTNYAAI